MSFTPVFFANVFSQGVFQIVWSFHLCHPDPYMCTRSRGEKVKNTETYLQTHFRKYFVPSYECGVDKSTVALKGREVFNVTIQKTY